VGSSASMPSHILTLRCLITQRERELYLEKLTLDFKNEISSRRVNTKHNEQTTGAILIIFYKFVKSAMGTLTHDIT